MVARGLRQAQAEREIAQGPLGLSLLKPTRNGGLA